MITFIKALFIMVLQDPPEPIGPTPPGVPIDSLVAYLLIIAIILGCSTLIKHKKNKRVT